MAGYLSISGLHSGLNKYKMNGHIFSDDFRHEKKLCFSMPAALQVAAVSGLSLHFLEITEKDSAPSG